MDVKRVIGMNVTNICSCLKGKLKTSNGFKWMYLPEYESLNNTVVNIFTNEKLNK